ncbi:S-adenosyl-L-methionine-dependent methyltransferase [Geopyxis carbonaria]|nr:S-adenosyl-L-methionine-dependent methyltransferase [Geopyxis carbonaria]
MSDIGSDTWSLCSKTSQFRWEHGRRYNDSPSGEYWVPNDEKQLNQLDITHHMFLMALEGKLYLAPITERPHRVLDVGTGTGIWAMDFADRHPSAQVIGTDISPTMPVHVPPNCSFEIDDACLPWTFIPASFDFIHARMLYACIEDWPRFYAQALTTLLPGGWLEQVEVSIQFRCDDGTLAAESPLVRWAEGFLTAGERMGRTFAVRENMKHWIEEAGFDNVQERDYRLPVGTWGEQKALGKWCQAHFEEGVEGWVLGLFTRYLQWSLEETWEFINELRQALKDPEVHTYLDMKVVWAQKPIAP